MPRSLLEAHPAVFNRTSSSSCSPTPTSRPSLGISRSTPIALSSVILIALDADSYAKAQSAGSDLDERLARPDRDLVRHGAVVHVPGLGRWKVAMTEPVMQGEIVRKQTRLLVLPPTRNADSGSAEAADGTSTSASDTLADDEDEDDEPSGDSSQDAFADFDLDEAFLASSVLLPRKAHATPLTSPLPAHLDTHKMASFPMLEPSRTLYEEMGHLVGAAPLDFAISSELLTPEPDADEDDNWRAFVSTQDLGRLGLFSGDWAVLRQSASSASGAGGGGSTPCGRLIRVFAADACLPTSTLKGCVRSPYAALESIPTDEASFDSDHSPSLFLPPQTLYNLVGTPALSASAAEPCTLSLVPAPAVSSILPAPLPVASSVTIARLATPHSVNKVFQPLFLDALKEHFQNKRRKVVKGDVIAVGIAEDKIRFVRDAKDDALPEDEIEYVPRPAS